LERTIIAYSLMAILVAAGIAIGLYLRRNSRERSIARQRAREKFMRKERTAAAKS
jgi:hypothetical protein